MDAGFRLTEVFEPVLRGDAGVLMLTAAAARKLTREKQNGLGALVDALGAQSAVAQKLAVPVTSWERFVASSGDEHQCIYVATVPGSSRSVRGFIKTGVKTLFVHHKSAVWREIMPICVLDFFTDATFRRQGVGKLLFDAMLASEGNNRAKAGRGGTGPISPSQLAYDRPSPLFLSFLRKYFGLASYTPQANAFVVFDAFFDPAARSESLVGAAGPATGAPPSGSTAALPHRSDAAETLRRGATAAADGYAAECAGARASSSCSRSSGGAEDIRYASRGAVPASDSSMAGRGYVGHSPPVSGGAGTAGWGEVGSPGGGTATYSGRTGAAAAPFATALNAECGPGVISRACGPYGSGSGRGGGPRGDGHGAAARGGGYG
jgi:alpha-tubulin N-acetyltransferase 1